MTTNQLTLMGLVETKRNNLAVETETHRANVTRETETQRHNLATENITASYNAASINLGYQQLAETRRSNLAREANTAAEIREKSRSNLANEAIARMNAFSTQRQADASMIGAIADAAYKSSLSTYNILSLQRQRDRDAMDFVLGSKNLQLNYDQLQETRRHNMVSEMNAATKNSLDYKVGMARVDVDKSSLAETKRQFDTMSPWNIGYTRSRTALNYAEMVSKYFNMGASAAKIAIAAQ